MFGIEKAVRKALREEWNGLLGQAWISGYQAREPVIDGYVRDAERAREYAQTIVDENEGLKGIIANRDSIIDHALLALRETNPRLYEDLQTRWHLNMHVNDPFFIDEDANVRNDGSNRPANSGSSNRPLGQGGVDNNISTVSERVISSSDGVE